MHRFLPFLFLLPTGALLPQAGLAQAGPVISANFRNVPLPEVFNMLEKKYPLSFSYDDALVRSVRITARFRREPLESALRALLTPHRLDFEILENHYVLIKNGPQETVPPPRETAPPVGFTYCGKVVGPDTGEPLPGAFVRLKTNGAGAMTNGQGLFRFTTPFIARDSLIVSCMGFDTQTFPLGTPGAQPCRDYMLRPSQVFLESTVIRDFATDLLRLDSTGRSTEFKPQRLPTLPGWGDPDVLRVLQLLPGVQSMGESAAALHVRGGTPDQNLVLWDNIPIYHTGHFFGLYDAFNPYIVQEVRFFSGNFGAEYGGRTSSVIDISGKPQYDDGRWHAGLGANLLHLHGYVEMPFRKDKWRVLVAGRRSYSDLIKSRTYQNLFNQIFQNGRVVFEREQESENQDAITWKPRFYYYDYNLKSLWTPNDKHHLALSAYAGKDVLNYRFTYDDGTDFLTTSDALANGNHGLGFEYKGQWSPAFKASYNASLSRYAGSYVFRVSLDPATEEQYALRQRNLLSDLTLRLNHDYRFSEQGSLGFGYQSSVYGHEIEQLDFDHVLGTVDRIFTDTSTALLHTVYGEARLMLTDRLLVQLGFRENYYAPHRYFYSEPRFFAQWKPGGKGWRLKASYGKYYQFLFQLRSWNSLGVGDASWLIANEFLPAQETWQGTAGVQFDNERMLFSLEVYGKHSLHLTSVNLPLKPEIDNPYTFEGTSDARGIDLLLRRRWNQYSVWLSYSLGRVDQRFPGLNYDEKFPARHDVRHNLNVVHMLATKQMDFSLNVHLNSGIPYSVPGVYDVECAECYAGTTQGLYYDRLNTARLPAVLRLDLAANWKIEREKWRAKIGFSIYNLLNGENLLDKDFLLELPAPEEPQIGTLQVLNRRAAGLTPNLVLQFGF